MTDKVGISPRALARIAGALYILVIIIGAYVEVGIRGPATAANLHAMEWLWRAGIGLEVFLGLICVPITMILYVLLCPVSKPLVLMATFFNLLGIAIEAAMCMYLFEAMLPLRTSAYLSAFAPEQLNAVARLALEEHTYGYAVALIFFACYQITIGVVIFKSGYMPKLVGVLMQIGGLGYLVNNFAVIVYPSITSWLFPVSAVPALLGELSLALFLLFEGVHLEKYRARVALQAA